MKGTLVTPRDCAITTFLKHPQGSKPCIGWSGQVALAQAGFFGVGAYGTAYLVAHGVGWWRPPFTQVVTTPVPDLPDRWSVCPAS